MRLSVISKNELPQTSRNGVKSAVKLAPVAAQSQTSEALQIASGILILLSYALLIFWRFPGLTVYQYDDYGHSLMWAMPKLPTDLSSYMHFVSNRDLGMDVWTYKSLYNLFGNFDVPIFAFTAVYILSAIFLFLALRKICSSPAALLGALVYFTSIPKNEAVLVFNCGMYSVLMCSAVAILSILHSKLKYATKLGIPCVLYWVSLHFYEILTPAVPLLSAWALAPAFSRTASAAKGFGYCLCASAPVAITALHFWLLTLNPHARMLDGVRADSHHLDGLWGKAIGLMGIGFSKLIGAEHFSLMANCASGFFRFEVPKDWSLLVPLIASIACNIMFVFLSVRARTFQRVESSLNWQLGLLLCGAYIALLCPMTWGVFSWTDMPQRMFFFPAFGLGLVTCALVDFVRGNIRVVVITAVALYCMIEAIAFSSIVRMFMFAGKFDADLTKKIMAVPNLRLDNNAKLFVSLPYDRRKDSYWRFGLPTYYCSAYPIRLWRAINHGFYPFEYESVTREKNDITPHGLPTFLSQNEKNGCRLYPLFVTDSFDVKPIAEVSVQQQTGKMKTFNTAFGPSQQPSNLHLQLSPDARIYHLY